MALPITENSDGSAQNTTGTPQTASSAGFTTQQSSSVQPNASTNALNTGGQQGITLGGFSPDARTAAPRTQTQVTAQTTTHVSPTLVGVSSLFVLIALGLCWYIVKSAKNTTY